MKSYHHGNLKEELIKAACVLCEREGYTKLSIRNLAKESNVSQTAPYRHFKTKECVYAAVAERGFSKLSKVIAKAKIKLSHLASHLPNNITFIKTSGADEGGAPYTRGNSVILPKRQVSQSVKSLERLFYHELFHIISRNNQQLRDELYSIIGFKPCGVVKLVLMM